MDRRKTPEQKKAYAYARDHIVGAEYRQHYPRFWNRKKAQVNRKFRRQVHQALLAAADQVRRDPLCEQRAEAIRRDRIRKQAAAIPLGEWVQGRLERRVILTLLSYFRSAYTTIPHRERFASFLATVVQGRTARSQRIASRVERYLDGPLDGHGSIWLRAFLQDAPEWEERLRAWIAQVRRKR